MVIPDTVEADSGLPQVLLRWGSLRSILTDSIPADRIEYGKHDTITGYVVSEDGEVSLLTNCGNEIGPSSAPLIIGADGIHSTFRQCVINDITEQPDFDKRQEGLKYNKRVNVKAIVQSVLNEETFKPNHTYSFFTPGGGTACFAGPAGEGYTYWATSIADENGEKNDISSLAFSPEMDKEAMKAALLSRLRNLEQPLCEFAVQMIEATEPRYIYVQISQEAEIIGPRLASKDGKVVCVGDAAHPMSSSYGQAVNFALEDAATLAVCVRDSDDLASALKSYEVSRLDRCNEMVRRSAERAAKSMQGEQVEDISKWIFKWNVPADGH